MKPKLAKRSLLNKHSHQRSFPTPARRLSTPHDYNRTISPNKINSETETTQPDSDTLCLKPNVPLKSQKLLKRDLLRCSNQRPSLLGSQTLQPPRIHHGSQPNPSVVPSSFSHPSTKRQSSLPDNPQTLHATINRIGPWPDISINCLRSEGTHPLEPLKNFRTTKNPRLFSPKYYAALSETNTKFRFYPSKRSYIEEYRKEKGYVISSRPTPQPTSLSSSSLGRLQYTDEDQLSAHGTINDSSGSYTARDRTDLSTTNLSLAVRGLTKSVDDITDNNRLSSHSHPTNQSSNLPTIPIRHNNPLRNIRLQPQQHQTVTLPTITSSLFPHSNSINSNGTPPDDRKTLSIQNQSKLYFIDGRQQKSDNEVTSRSQDYAGLRTTGSPMIPETDRSAAVVLYQLSRRT